MFNSPRETGRNRHDAMLDEVADAAAAKTGLLYVYKMELDVVARVLWASVKLARRRGDAEEYSNCCT